jgi:hypothetical protein
MANEAYRIRSLAFVWEKRAGNACEAFQDYKGGRDCVRCGCFDAAHEARRCAAELRALLAEPEDLAPQQVPAA